MAGIDAMRFAAVYAVVLIHAMGQRAPWGLTAGNIVDQVSRFAVPFFFMTGGFFLGRRDLVDTGGIVRDLAVRLIPMYVAWTAVYVMLSGMTLRSLATPKELLSILATGGPGYHLWFLPSYGLCMAVVAYLVRYLCPRRLLLVALAMYVVGLLLGSYAGLILPSGHTTNINLSLARGGPCFGTVFVALGYCFAQRDLRSGAGFAICVLAAGISLHLAEAWALNSAGMNAFIKNDFLVGTLLSGSGAFLLSRTLPSTNRLVQWAALLGQRYVLGIYVLHLIIVIELDLDYGPLPFWPRLTASVVVLAVSIVATMAIARIPKFRFLVV
jgi:surface polysaccharide O-acyltransferase-like enzyme